VEKFMKMRYFANVLLALGLTYGAGFLIADGWEYDPTDIETKRDPDTGFSHETYTSPVSYEKTVENGAGVRRNTVPTDIAYCQSGARVIIDTSGTWTGTYTLKLVQ
jgi:hypothetical protein